MNPFSLVECFNLDDAVRAVTGIFEPKDPAERATVKNTTVAVTRAIDAGELPAQVREVQHYQPVGMRRIRMDDNTDDRPLVPSSKIKHFSIARADLLPWCESRGIRPALLFPDLPTEKPLHASERKTLLIIIRALAELHGIKPLPTRATGDGWRKAADALLSDLSAKGIMPPVKDPQTLAEKLREAFALRG